MKKYSTLFALAFFLYGVSLAWSYTQEQQEAYDYAYSQGITTVSSIEKVNMNGSLTRIAMAKMLSNFSINVLWLQPNRTVNCSFNDVSKSLDLQYDDGVMQVCQLWLMWIWDDWKKSEKFSPNAIVTRWQFVTALSRALNRYDWTIIENGNPYYSTHLSYLNKKWIIKNINRPSPLISESRWNVMIMLMRAAKIVKNREELDIVEQEEKDEKNEDIVWKKTESNDIENKVSLDGDNKTNSDDLVKIEYHRVENSYDNFVMNDFNAVEDIYHNIKLWDRVIFVVRHSERITNCTSEWGLTDNGVELAKWVGEKLKWAPFEDTSNDFYWSSIVKRTVQTSYYVWKSRGSKVLEKELDSNFWMDYEYVNHSSDIDSIVYGNYFSDGNSYSSIEHLYEENRNVVKERALYMINKICDITDWHPFSWITSHDWFTLPITEWATDEHLTFSQSKSEWPNFMQGVAIIVHKDWWWEIYPVKSLDAGKMATWENPGC